VVEVGDVLLGGVEGNPDEDRLAVAAAVKVHIRWERVDGSR